MRRRREEGGQRPCDRAHAAISGSALTWEHKLVKWSLLQPAASFQRAKVRCKTLCQHGTGRQRQIYLRPHTAMPANALFCLIIHWHNADCYFPSSVEWKGREGREEMKDAGYLLTRGGGVP